MGSGLGPLAEKIEDSIVIPYQEIPNFPVPTVEGHAGNLHLGWIAGVPVAGFQGRTHYYEVANRSCGAGPLTAVFYVHALANAEVNKLFLTSAVGGLGLDQKVGDLMIISSHLSDIPSPNLGRHLNLTRLDTRERVFRFTPMNDAYDDELRALLREAGKTCAEGHMHEGPLYIVKGTEYETPAQCQAYRALGMKGVGMSMAPEVTAARSRGMRCVGMSTITNTVDENGINATSHKEVTKILESPEVTKRLEDVTVQFFKNLRDNFV